MSRTIGPPNVAPNWCWAKSGVNPVVPPPGKVWRKVGGEGVVLAEVVRRAVELVGPRLGDDVEEAAARPAELRVGAIGDHHEVLHRVEVEGERRALAAPLLAEERVVEVGAVHRDVVVDAALAADADLVAVGPLHDGDVGRQRGEVEDVAAVVGQPLHRLHAQPGGRLRLRHIHRRLGGRDGDLLQLHRLRRQREGEVHRLAQSELTPALRLAGSPAPGPLTS